MKRKKLILLFLLALPAAVWAQTLNNAQLTPSTMPNADQKLVRNWDDRWVVSYHVNATGSYFSCTDYSDFYLNYPMLSSPSFFTTPILAEYSIMDMEIVDDCLFFCGSKKSGTAPGPYTYKGFVGWFDLNSFFSSTAYSLNIKEIDCVITLDKMAAYKTTVGYNIAAVGVNSNVPVPPYSLPRNSTIVEFSDVTGTPTCNYAIIDLSIGVNEFLEDVVYTGQYVAFVGVVKSSSTRLYHVRIMDNPNSLPASTSGDYIHIFSSSPSYEEVNGRLLPAVIDENTIALTYVYHDMVLNTDETRLRVIELSSTPTNINSQVIPKDQKEEPIDMIYSTKDDSLVLLQNFKYIIDDHPQFAFLNPFLTTSYNAFLLYPQNGETYNSLDIYNGRNFVSVGNGNQTFLQVITSPTLPSCLGLDKVKVGELKSDNTTSDYTPLLWQVWPISPANPPLVNMNDFWSVPCSYR